MSTVAYLVLLCICIALAVLVYLMYLEIIQLKRRLDGLKAIQKANEQAIIDVCDLCKKNIGELSRRIETLSGQNGVLNNKVTRLSIGMDLLKKQIKDIGTTHENI